MTVAAGYSAWLQSDARYQTAVVSGAAAAWGDKAVSTDIISPFAYQANGAAEAARQAAFLAGPFAIDTMIVPGQRGDMIGRAVTLYGDRFGYEAGSIVFVIETDETAFPGMTALTVLKRL